jgi:hypothetical protein
MITSIENLKKITWAEAIQKYDINEAIQKSNIHYIPSDAYKADDLIYIVEEDAHFDNLEIDKLFWPDGFIGVIFCKNLSATTNIVQKDMDYGPLCIVLGNVTAQNVYFSGGTIYVRGNVTVNKTLVCGVYNHGETYIKGDITAEVLISLDHMFNRGNIKEPTIFVREYWRFNLEKDDNLLLLKEGILVDEEEYDELYFDIEVIENLLFANESLLKK